MKRVIFLILCSVVMMSLTSCNTIQKSTKGFVKGFQEGAKEDWGKTGKIDSWMKENLW